MTSGRVAVLGLAALTRTATGLRYRSVGELSYPESSYSRKLVYPMTANFMFEKINEDEWISFSSRYFILGI
jgi:hypothetical protein